MIHHQRPTGTNTACSSLQPVRLFNLNLSGPGNRWLDWILDIQNAYSSLAMNCIFYAKTISGGRKVRALQDTMVGNAHQPRGSGKCRRKQTASRLLSVGKGEKVR